MVGESRCPRCATVLVGAFGDYCPECKDTVTAVSRNPTFPVKRPAGRKDTMGSGGKNSAVADEPACPRCGTVLVGAFSDYCPECKDTVGVVSRSPVSPTSHASQPKVDESVGVPLFDASMIGATGASAPVRYEYLVMTMKDRFFGGKFDPAKLQEALNAYAREGWRLNSTATADLPGISFNGQGRNEIIFILERERRGN